ncbi:TMEM175 family protein [Pseudonocardia sp. 73-21]|uniref:TMEM175 family protein n=1 Tax=Pseudonocardia sp. 73-21 TaxID=1895809 RepID=UPI000969F749|nr:TMEM175 family protein [Pseudonocardia sp. 73-21]OJY39885.1 MAG: hypothetical protein BGP03_21665 [Pseudonocardia sp. 73-21]
MTDDRAAQGLDRLAAFSDGVFAIAITLLVLPLADAEIDPGHVGESLAALAPRGLTFALSFAVIGRYWLVHHDNVRALVRSDRGLLVLNLAFLFCIAFMPFPTSVLGGTDGGTAATVLYAVTIIATSVAAAALWWYATFHRKLVDPEVHSDAHAREAITGSLSAAVAFLPSIPLAFIDPTWAKYSWLLAVPLGFLADRFPRRRVST